MLAMCLGRQLGLTGFVKHLLLCNHAIFRALLKNIVKPTTNTPCEKWPSAFSFHHAAGKRGFVAKAKPQWKSRRRD
jgi:hypothetical protein